jgi:hypothetical protein
MKATTCAILTSTDGSGLWSDEKRKVLINKFEVTGVFRSIPGKKLGGSLLAHFKAKDWNTDKHGLIYTDKNWIKDFRSGLEEMGFSKSAVMSINYSEQGRQGDFWVDLDIGDAFIKEFALINTFGEIEEF